MVPVSLMRSSWIHEVRKAGGDPGCIPCLTSRIGLIVPPGKRGAGRPFMCFVGWMISSGVSLTPMLGSDMPRLPWKDMQTTASISERHADSGSNMHRYSRRIARRDAEGCSGNRTALLASRSELCRVSAVDCAV